MPFIPHSAFRIPHSALLLTVSNLGLIRGVGNRDAISLLGATEQRIAVNTNRVPVSVLIGIDAEDGEKPGIIGRS